MTIQNNDIVPFYYETISYCLGNCAVWPATICTFGHIFIPMANTETNVKIRCLVAEISPTLICWPVAPLKILCGLYSTSHSSWFTVLICKLVGDFIRQKINKTCTFHKLTRKTLAVLCKMNICNCILAYIMYYTRQI